MIQTCDSYTPLNTPLGNRPLCFRTTVAGRGIHFVTATMRHLPSGYNTQPGKLGFQKIHGQRDSREYGIWASMKSRCHNPNVRCYPRYGGRGIAVCDRWLYSFEDFLADMGKCPFPGAQIDRIDSEKGYFPENCRWADLKTQARNKSNNHFVVIDGQSKTIAEWSEISGHPRRSIGIRIARGWNPKNAVFLPAQPRGRPPKEKSDAYRI